MPLIHLSLSLAPLAQCPLVSATYFTRWVHFFLSIANLYRVQMSLLHQSARSSVHVLLGLPLLFLSSVIPKTTCFISLLSCILHMWPKKFIFASHTYSTITSSLVEPLDGVTCLQERWCRLSACSAAARRRGSSPRLERSQSTSSSRCSSWPPSSSSSAGSGAFFGAWLSSNLPVWSHQPPTATHYVSNLPSSYSRNVDERELYKKSELMLMRRATA